MRFSRVINGLLAAAAAATAGCGVSQELYNARTTELDRCQGELTRNRSQMEAIRSKSDELATESSGLREHVTTLESERFKLASNLQATQKEMDELRHAHSLAEQRSELYRALVSKLRPMVDAHTLGVDIRKGKMVLELGEQILFEPGKAVLKGTGEAALRQVAAVLREVPDRDFLVAGHTDNRPLKASAYHSNWELSSARAVAVVQFLQAEGVDPRRMAAAGYSEFDPITSNATENRTLNRRIEVVVMPNTDELPSIDPTLNAGPAPSPRPSASDAAQAPLVPTRAPRPSPAPPQS